jgi:hypothetical protein
MQTRPATAIELASPVATVTDSLSFADRILAEYMAPAAVVGYEESEEILASDNLARKLFGILPLTLV